MYAKDEALFKHDFGNAFARLVGFGAPEADTRARSAMDVATDNFLQYVEAMC